jgi:hypothetical protein
MNMNTVRVGFGLRPGEPFWVQVCKSVQQRAHELDITLVPVTLPDFLRADESIIDTIEKLKAQELGALILHVLPDRFLLAILNEGLPVICSEDTALTHPLLVSVHGLAQAATMAAEYLAMAMSERTVCAGQLSWCTGTFACKRLQSRLTCSTLTSVLPLRAVMSIHAPFAFPHNCLTKRTIHDKANESVSRVRAAGHNGD